MLIRRTIPAFIAAALLCGLGACSTILRDTKNADDTIEIHNAGTGVNSDHDEYAPQISPDGKTLVFTTNKPVRKKDEGNDKIFRSDRKDDSWSTADQVATNAGENTNEGSVVFDRAHNQVLFVQCYRPDGVGDCDLYVADLEGTVWTNIRNAGGPLNSPDWDSHPTITADGKTLYFASERHGCMGGSDIWRAERRDDGTWSEPVNIGAPVNTRGDEKTPFISPDGSTLYFSSNQHTGYGGYDIFRSEKQGNTWTMPVNLGKPYNSSADDLFYVSNAKGDTAFVASDRGGGFGGFDIYQIIRKPPPPPPPKPKPLIVHFSVRNKFTHEPVNAKLVLALGKEEKTLKMYLKGEAEDEIRPGEEYGVTASAEGFQYAVDSVYYPPNTVGLQQREILLTPISENEQKIYGFVVEFDFDFFNIRPSERQHLDSCVTLLTLYPNSTVIASGHTDSVGTEAYNLTLGYNRAKEVSKYLVRYIKERGVTLRNELEIRTFGKSQPVATNETEAGRQRNRRVEIAIIRHE